MRSFRARVGGIPAEVVRVLVFYLNEDFNKPMFIYKSYRRHKIRQTLFKQSDKEVGRIYLEFWVSWSNLWVTEERDERRSGSVLFVVVWGAVTVVQLNQPIVVRQTGVLFPKTPNTKEKNMM